MEKKLMRFTAKEIAFVGLFTALIAVGGLIKINLFIVPFTMQVLFTLLAALLLGPRLGGLAVILYVGLGLIGVPILAAGGGPLYVLKPTFGYLIGFIVSTYVVGTLAGPTTKRKIWQKILINLLGLLIIYGLGVIYFYYISRYVLMTPKDWSFTLYYAALVFLPTDGFWCIVAALLSAKLQPLLSTYIKKPTQVV